MWCAKSCKTHATAFARLCNERGYTHKQSRFADASTQRSREEECIRCRRKWLFCFRGLGLARGRAAVQPCSVTRVMSSPCDRFRRTFRSWCTSRTAVAHRVCCITSCACCSNELLERRQLDSTDSVCFLSEWHGTDRIPAGPLAPCSVDTAELPNELAAVRAMRKVCIDDLRSEVKKTEADMDCMTDASNEAHAAQTRCKPNRHPSAALRSGACLGRWRARRWRRRPKTISRSRCFRCSRLHVRTCSGCTQPKAQCAPR
jgi:hypothetical protein